MQLRLLALCVCLASAGPLGGQAVTPQVPTIQARASLVLVPALVRDKRGELIYGLGANDFALTDDGVPQQVTLLPEAVGQPIALVVVLEAGAATEASGWRPGKRELPGDRFQTLPTMVEAMVEAVPHQVAVIGFDSRPEVLQPFTAHLDRVAEAIHDFTAEDEGDHGAAILDSLGMAVELLRKQPPESRRVILLLSESRDRGSKLALDDAVRAITETNTAVYALSYSTARADVSHYARQQLPTKLSAPHKRSPSLPEDFTGQSNAAAVASAILGAMTLGVGLENPTPNPPNGCMGKPIDPADAPKSRWTQAYDCLAQLVPPLTLAKMATIAVSEGLQRNVPQTVARLTGGESFALVDADRLERDLATIANHFPNRYLLSFQPQQPHAGLHVLSLRLRDRPGQEVTARSTYWAGDAAKLQ